MRITILTFGTEGDVRPFLALAVGLRRAGFEATLAAPLNVEDLVTRHGVAYAPIGVDLRELMRTDQFKEMQARPLRAAKHFRSLVMPMFQRVLDDSWTAAQDSDAIIYHPKILGGCHIAERLNVPCFIGATVPLLSPTRRFPLITFPHLRLGGTVNRLSHSAMRLMMLPFSRMINRWRRDALQLPPCSALRSSLHVNARRIPILYCYSRHVVPAPDDWPDTATVTGYWFLDRVEQWRPSIDLIDFIESGPPPVYVGFGSLTTPDPEQTTTVVVRALQQAGTRGIIATGWGGLGRPDLPNTILEVGSVPHDWLFPRVSAVVHHGGAGSVGAGLRAGRPTVVCPHGGDQPFWAKVLFDLGVSPEPVPLKRLSVSRLASAIVRATTDTSVRDRTIELGEKIRAEDGVTRAVELISNSLTP